MRAKSASELRGLAMDVSGELAYLQRTAAEIALLRRELAQDPARATIYYENLALKLHNFYTGCERIFRIVASDLNGAAPDGFDWHRRLLERMGTGWEDRPALLSAQSIHDLREYLGFRHVVRNIYGLELDRTRIERLLVAYPAVWAQVESDIRAFVDWMYALATRLDAS